MFGLRQSGKRKMVGFEFNRMRLRQFEVSTKKMSEFVEPNHLHAAFVYHHHGEYKAGAPFVCGKERETRANAARRSPPAGSNLERRAAPAARSGRIAGRHEAVRAARNPPAPCSRPDRAQHPPRR